MTTPPQPALGALEQLRALSEAATPGPWEWVQPHTVLHRIRPVSVEALVPIAAVEGLFSRRHANGEFIVAAVNYVRAVLARHGQAEGDDYCGRHALGLDCTEHGLRCRRDFSCFVRAALVAGEDHDD